jgi:CBS domain-containing protein
MISVRDIMQSDVTTATADMSVHHLTRLLADAEVSGVPVVDSAGSLVGVVSATDVIRFASEDGGLPIRPGLDASELVTDPDQDEEPLDPYGFFLPEDSPIASGFPFQDPTESRFETATVAEIMTPVTFSVSPSMPVTELADFLVRGRIHRAVVVEGGRLAGIVTSGDILTAVADERVAVRVPPPAPVQPLEPLHPSGG